MITGIKLIRIMCIHIYYFAHIAHIYYYIISDKLLHLTYGQTYDAYCHTTRSPRVNLSAYYFSRMSHKYCNVQVRIFIESI